MAASSTVKDLGTLSGKLLVFGGVYGNFQALEAMKTVADELGIHPSNIICTGDVAGYCAQPVDCCALIESWGIHCIAGNVELQLINDADDCGCDFTNGSRCDLFSKNWYAYTKQNIGPSELSWMKTLPNFLRFQYAGRRTMVIHGSYFETAGYIFWSTDWKEKQKNLDAAKSDIILAGHSGLPFSQSEAGQAWINAGVIGMPANDGDTRVWYSLIEESEAKALSVQLCQLEYNHQVAAALMLEAGLPKQYATTLKAGIWDNCEILPEIETKQQGQRIMPEILQVQLPAINYAK